MNETQPTASPLAIGLYSFGAVINFSNIVGLVHFIFTLLPKSWTVLKNTRHKHVLLTLFLGLTWQLVSVPHFLENFNPYLGVPENILRVIYIFYFGSLNVALLLMTLVGIERYRTMEIIIKPKPAYYVLLFISVFTIIVGSTSAILCMVFFIRKNRLEYEIAQGFLVTNISWNMTINTIMNYRMVHKALRNDDFTLSSQRSSDKDSVPSIQSTKTAKRSKLKHILTIYLRWIFTLSLALLISYTVGYTQTASQPWVQRQVEYIGSGFSCSYLIVSVHLFEVFKRGLTKAAAKQVKESRVTELSTVPPPSGTNVLSFRSMESEV